jgi:hypothetical protein
MISLLFQRIIRIGVIQVKEAKRQGSKETKGYFWAIWMAMINQFAI